MSVHASDWNRVCYECGLVLWVTNEFHPIEHCRTVKSGAVPEDRTHMVVKGSVVPPFRPGDPFWQFGLRPRG